MSKPTRDAVMELKKASAKSKQNQQMQQTIVTAAVQVNEASTVRRRSEKAPASSTVNDAPVSEASLQSHVPAAAQIMTAITGGQFRGQSSSIGAGGAALSQSQ